MIFSSRQLSDIVGLPIVLADRRNLTAEDKFAHAINPAFSPQELSEREDDLREILSPAIRVPPNCDWLSVYAGLGTIWHVSQNKLGPWTYNARKIGQNLFGARFEDTQGFCHTTGGVIIPTSPHLDSKGFWKAFTSGLPVTMPRENNLEGLLQLHEGAHCLFPFTLEDRQDNENAYRYEAYADCFAVTKYRELKGPEQDIQDFIAGRRLHGFIDFMPAYNTAPACEAVLDQEPFPTFKEALDPLRELQIRVIDDLQGIDRRKWSTEKYRKKCSSVTFKGKQSVAIDDFWSADHDGIYNILTQFSSQELIGSLNKVLKWNISDEARAEGQKTMAAFVRLCPDSTAGLKPTEATPPQRAAAKGRAFSRKVRSFAKNFVCG
jgi:hypothetical protein